MDFSTVPGRGLSTYQLLISGFPLVNFEVEVVGNEYASGVASAGRELFDQHELRFSNDGVHSIYLTSDFDPNKTYQPDEAIILSFWYQVDHELPQLIKTTRIQWVSNTPSENTPVETGVKIYRLYNPNNGDHLFTQSYKEYQDLERIGTCWLARRRHCILRN